jgi:hypothetical protein
MMAYYTEFLILDNIYNRMQKYLILPDREALLIRVFI